MRPYSLLFRLLLVGLYAGPLAAQESSRLPKFLRDWLPQKSAIPLPIAPPVPAPPTATLPLPDSGASSDPTQPQGELRRLLNQSENGTPSAPPALPGILLRARVLGPRGAMALLEVAENKPLLFVQAGERYAFTSAGDTEFEVVGIDQAAVELKLYPSGRRLLLP